MIILGLLFISLAIGALLAIFWQESDEDYWLSEDSRKRVNRYAQLERDYITLTKLLGQEPTTTQLWDYSRED